MNRYLRYTLLGLLWAAVAAYVVWAAVTAQRARGKRQVTALRIEVVDSTSRGHLVSTQMVRSWIAASGIPTLGTTLDKVNLAGLETLVARNGFVERTVARVTYAGELRISVSQRTPVVRLLLEGMDSYSTEEGFVFASPRASSLYVPVVTGSYRPPFPATYAGGARAYTDLQRRELEDRIAKLEKDKYPLYKRELQNDRDISALRRMRVKRRWWRLEGAREFEARQDDMRKLKVKLRRDYRYRARVIQDEIDAVTQRQAEQRAQQKKLEKSYEDFMKLVTFVTFVEENDFWRSEVVQIVAHTSSGGALEVDLIPRSGRHTVLFGRLEEIEEKFDKLLLFYQRGLAKVGWDEYRTVDIRYSDQVVCKK